MNPATPELFADCELAYAAQRVWTSALRIGAGGQNDPQFCSILNHAIRSQDETLTVHAAVIARSMDKLLVNRLQPLLRADGTAAVPYPPTRIAAADLQAWCNVPCGCNAAATTAAAMVSPSPAASTTPALAASYAVSYRGCWLPDQHKSFFAPGKEFRIAAFFATSFNAARADQFAASASGPMPGGRLTWRVHLDARGATDVLYRCTHVNLIADDATHVPGTLPLVLPQCTKKASIPRCTLTHNVLTFLFTKIPFDYYR
jgi:hypothetical protein